MRLYDISVPVSDRLPTWPGDPAFKRTLADSIAKGDAANVSHLDMGAHTGTHVDAPVHFIAGARGIETIPLESLVGSCVVVAAEPAGPELTPDDLPPGRAERVLFKTRNSQRWSAHESSFDTEFVAVGPALAIALVERGVKLVGVDYLSVEKYKAPLEHPVHKTLLEAGIVIVEGLDLSAVEPGEYELVCLPLKLVGSDGAPARAVLVDRKAAG